jgi:hypothetical protein
VLLVSILPAFYVISHYGITATLLGATAVLASLLNLSSCPVIIWLTESFPVGIRSGSVAIIYAFSIALFGGTTQFTLTWLIKVTGNPLAPAWYWTAATIVGIAAMSATHESAPRKAAKPGTLLVEPPRTALCLRIARLDAMRFSASLLSISYPTNTRFLAKRDQEPSSPVLLFTELLHCNCDMHQYARHASPDGNVACNKWLHLSWPVQATVGRLLISSRPAVNAREKKPSTAFLLFVLLGAATKIFRGPEWL